MKDERVIVSNKLFEVVIVNSSEPKKDLELPDRIRDDIRNHRMVQFGAVYLDFEERSLWIRNFLFFRRTIHLDGLLRVETTKRGIILRFHGVEALYWNGREVYVRTRHKEKIAMYLNAWASIHGRLNYDTSRWARRRAGG